MPRKVLLTGGSGLIGLHLVKSLIKHGYCIYITTRNKKKLLMLINKYNLNMNDLNIIECDLLHNKAKEKIISKIPKDLDCIIFNARSLESVKLDNKGNLSDKQWLNEFKMATVLPYQLTKLLIDKDISLKDIVFVSSIYGTVVPNPALYDNYHLDSAINYGVIKASQIQLAKEMAVRFIKSGIRTNCISFGGVEGRANDQFVKRHNNISPIGRMLNERDLFPPLRFILENENLAINGENLIIDGGWTLI